MNPVKSFALVLACAVAGVPASSSAENALANLSASQINTRMTLAMRAEETPPAISYTETFVPDGLAVEFQQVHGITRSVFHWSGERTNRVFDVRQRPGSGITLITDHLTGASTNDTHAFWGATWAELHRANAPTPLATPTPDGSSRGISGTGLAVVADVVSIGDRFYLISVSGIEKLGNSEAFHLHLIAREDKVAHPLTDVYVDVHSFLVLRAVAAFKNEAMISGDSGTISLDFGRSGNYWLVQSGTITARAHVFFKSMAGSVRFFMADVTFPGA